MKAAEIKDNFVASCQPPAKIRLLERRHISDMIEKAIRSHPLVVMTAPPGYGKSNEARKMLERFEGWRVYYSIIPWGQISDNRLWDVVFGQIAEQGSKHARYLQQMGYPQDAFAFQYVMEKSKKDVDEKPALLVFDDFHLANSPQLNTYVEAVTRLNYPNLRILILTRGRPNLPLEELRIKGFAVVIGQGPLTFSREESREFFASNGVADPAVADLAWEYTEGWAAALWLSLQSYMTSGIIEPVHDLDKLISETIFFNYEVEDQVLLLKLSLLERFTLRQVAIIGGGVQASHRLQMLHDRNAFLLFEPVSDSYRLHSIFRSYLAKHLEQCALPACREIDLAELYSNAGKCCLDVESYVQAMQFFLKAGTDEDLLQILKIFEIPKTANLLVLDPEKISDLVLGIPWRIRFQCPMGYLGFICSYLLLTTREKGRRLLDEAEEHFGAEPGITEDGRRAIQGEIEVCRGMMAYNAVEALCKHYEKAYKLLRGPSRLITGRYLWAFSYVTTVHSLFKEGDFLPHIKLLQDKRECIEGLAGELSAGVYELLLAEYMLETGEYKEAEVLIRKSLYKSAGKGQFLTTLARTYTWCRLLIAQGEPEKAWEEFGNLQATVEKINSLLILRNYQFYSGLLAVILNKAEGIHDWMLELSDAGLHGGFFAEGVLLFVRCKSLLTVKDWQSLDIVLEDAHRHIDMPSVYYLSHRIHLLVLLAINENHKHNIELSLEYLYRAVNMARSDNLVTIIAEYGVHIEALLGQLLKMHPGDVFVARLVKRIRRYTKLDLAKNQNLSQREQYVLEKAQNGESNREIARQLGIASASVGNILSRIYRKLGITVKGGSRKNKGRQL